MTNPECLKLNIDIPNNKNVSYPIFIGTDTLKIAGKYVKEYTSSKKLLLVSNDVVYPLYGEQVKKSLEASNFIVESIILPDGEDYKNLDIFKQILDKAIDLKLERKDSIVALGGGVIGDMAGYAASSYLRGIN
ncbi:MAG: iron-containing alcohol dehydrogenase, partial [Vampirovibrionia bacterium]